MKRISKILITAAILFSSTVRAGVVQTDPVLTATIMAQAELLKKEYDKRNKKHDAILVCQTAIATAMEEVHKVEDKMLEYLSNASVVMQNLYQVKRITELAAVDIPKNLVELGESIPDNIKGTAITLFVNKTIFDTTADVTALSEIVTKLVTSHYSFKDSNDEQNINLLSAAERYSILQSVYYRLDRINWRLRITGYCLKTFGWQQLWKGIDRESWCNVMYGELMAKQLIKRWNQL